MSKDALSPETLFEHVQDAPYFHFPRFFAPEDDGHLWLPQPLAKAKVDADGMAMTGHHGEPLHEVVWAPNSGNAIIDRSVLPLDFVFTKFMAIELMVAAICILLFGLLGRGLRGGKAPCGKLPNLLEAFLVYLRDQVARPCIGKHDADRFLPFLWTLFFFVLGCNLFGMLPWMGSPTGSLAVTAVLALVTFGMVIYSGSKQLGFVGFLKAQVPHMDLPKPVAVLLIPLIFAIEILGLFIKHFVLSVRLLANMMAGHIVLAVLLGFIGAVGVYGVTAVGAVSIPSVLAATALSVLELFVAFLQAYIFTFLSALFIGAAVHPH